MSEHPLHQLAMQIRYDLTAAQGKLGELMRQVGELEPLGPTRESFMNGPVMVPLCEECGCGLPFHTWDCEVFQARCESRSAAEGSLPSESVGGESNG